MCAERDGYFEQYDQLKCGRRCRKTGNAKRVDRVTFSTPLAITLLTSHVFMTGDIGENTHSCLIA